MRRRHLWTGVAAVAAAATAAAVVLAAQPSGHLPHAVRQGSTAGRPGTTVPGRNPPSGTSPGTTTTVHPPASSSGRSGAGAVRGSSPSTLVATLSASIPRYASPGGPADGTVPASWYGAPSALPVIAQDNGYLEVRLAQRPDGSTAWIGSTSVRLSSTPYRIVIDLATERLMLYKLGRIVMSAPAGIGTTAAPTPTGDFFVAFYAKAPTPAWGPFVIVTSGHSRAISDWEDSGDAIMAIHGPLGSGPEIGTTGARVSHGCVRLHDAALEQLAVVPPGSPVDVID